MYGVLVLHPDPCMPSISICHNPAGHIPPLYHLLSPTPSLQVLHLAGYALVAGEPASWAGELLRQLARILPPP